MALSPNPEKKQKQLANLRLFERGKAPKSPGRPPKRDYLAEFKLYMEDKQRLASLFSDLKKKKPDIAMAYLAGKPAETVLLGGAADAPPVRVEEIEAASALARKNRGIDVPT